MAETANAHWLRLLPGAGEDENKLAAAIERIDRQIADLKEQRCELEHDAQGLADYWPRAEVQQAKARAA